MIASRSEYASENDWMKEQMRKYDLTKQQIETYMSHLDDYKQMIQEAGFKKYKSGR